MNFEDYLKSKNIDPEAFRIAEPQLWGNWKEEFEQIHPKSFTAQKLYLINPIRRKYLLKPELKTVDKSLGSPTPPQATAPEEVPSQQNNVSQQTASEKKTPPKPAPRPVFKPKPKTN